MSKPHSLILALLATFNCPLAQASYTYYSDPVAFQNLAGTTSTTDFEGIAPAGSSTNYFSGLTIGGVTITSSTGRVIVISGNAVLQGVAGSGNLGTGDFVEGDYYNNGVAGTTTFTPSAGILSLALNYRAYDQQPSLSTNVNGTFSVSVDGTAPFTITSSAISNFMGIISTTPISTVTITPTGGLPNPTLFAEFLHYDNLMTGGSATPEPGTLAMIGFGIIGLGLLRRK